MSARAVRIEPLDVVFQDLDCGQRCDLIRQITASPYTHVDVYRFDDGIRIDADRDAVAHLTKGRLTEATEMVAPVDLARSPHLTKIAGQR